MRLAALALLSLFVVSVARAQVSAELAQKAPDAAAISGIAEQSGHVRVIVEFAGGVAANQLRPDPAFLAPIKAQIASIQDTIIGAHFGSAATPSPGQGFPRGLNRFDIFPGFAINVTKTELDALASNPLVTGIQQDQLNPPVLLQSVPLIGMTNAYTAGGTGTGRAVGVIDTGVQSNHEFLSGKVVAEACFSNSGGGGGGVSLCPNGQNTQSGTGAADATTAQCLNGSTELCLHGTHVAGIAAGNNTGQSTGEPSNGVAKGAKIVAVQVFTRFNVSGSNGCGTATPPCVLSFDSDMTSALSWIFQNALTPSGTTLDSINISIGGGSFTGTCDTKPQKAPIDSLRTAGVATLIAAGNDGFTSSISSPACISTAIAVASADKNDVISSFSNMDSQVALFGPGGFGGGSCAFGANNADILGPIASGSSSTAYACLAGTSMATPHVTGTFAAIRTVCPNATVAQILGALQSTGLSITDNRSGGTQTKPRIRVDLAIQNLACTGGGSSKQATHDFNGDGKSDISWRQTTGAAAIWLMNGAQVVQSAGLGTIPTSWGIVGQRDFNGDGKHDWLWRDTSGNTAIWFLNGAQVSSSAGLGTIATNWSIVATGDFNGDGKGDIVWRDSQTGTVAIWLMNGTQVVQSASLGAIASNWVIAAAGDFNGDGKYDILWFDINSGTLAIWLMNGVQVQQSGGVAVVGSPWGISDVGDFNGDGKWDILWRNGTTGAVAIWFMNGLQVSSSTGVATVSNVWTIWLTGDYNGDGKSDLLWKDTSGNVAIWFMNGSQVSSSASLGNVGTSWAISWQAAE